MPKSNFVKETFYDLQYLIILFLFSLFGIYIFSKIINKNKSLINSEKYDHKF